MGLSPDQGKEFHPQQSCSSSSSYQSNPRPAPQTSAILAAEGQRATGKARGTASAILMSANGTSADNRNVKMRTFLRAKTFNFQKGRSLRFKIKKFAKGNLKTAGPRDIEK